MKNIPLRRDLTIYISNVDLKILEAEAICWAMTLDRCISAILRQWCDDHVASRKDK